MRELSKAFLAIGSASFVVATVVPIFLTWAYHFSYLTSRPWMPWMAIGISLERKWWMLASIFFISLGTLVRAKFSK